MTNYFEISSESEQKLSDLFCCWIDWFMDEIHLPLETPVYIDAVDKTFTVRDYIREVKEHFGFQNICKQRLSLAYVSGGRTRVLRFLTLTAPVVIGGIVLGDNTFI